MDVRAGLSQVHAQSRASSLPQFTAPISGGPRQELRKNFKAPSTLNPKRAAPPRVGSQRPGPAQGQPCGAASPGPRSPHGQTCFTWGERPVGTGAFQTVLDDGTRTVQPETPKGKAEKNTRCLSREREEGGGRGKTTHATLTFTLFAFYTFYIFHFIRTVQPRPQDCTDKREKPD